MQLGLPESLSSLVSRRFATARDGGHLMFSSTHLSIIYSSGIPFQLRYCPALANKPTGPPKFDGTRPDTKPDPFQDPSPDLLLAQLPRDNPAYALVLNKFPVIQNHFILATKAWKSQTDVLEKEDLETAYACVKAWAEGEEGDRPNSDRKLFAFFNSGDDSGASQPHRHLQFLPVEAMRQGDCGNWDLLLDRCSSGQVVGSSGFRQLSQLPFVHFAASIPPDPSAEMLHSIYLALYREAVRATEERKDSSDNSSVLEDGAIPTDGPAAISYNLGLTESAMMICPRRSNRAQVSVSTIDNNNINDFGVVALNGTILAGTLMVKAEAEWNELRSNQDSLTNILAAIGYPQPDSCRASSL